MRKAYWITLFTFLLDESPLSAQREVIPLDSISLIPVISLNPQIYKNKGNDSIWIYSGICKTLRTSLLTGDNATPFLHQLNKGSIPFLTVRGNIQYDFTYRSFVDTPFSQEEFSQHSIQTTLDLTVREKYPVRVTILHRNSNSPYFDDLTDVSVQFNQAIFLKQMKNKLIQKIPNVVNRVKLSEIEKLYQQKKWEIEALQHWIKSPGRLQDMVEARERQVISAIRAAADSLPLQELPTIPTSIPDKEFLKKRVFAEIDLQAKKYKDSISAQIDSLVAAKKTKIDSLADNDILARFQKKKEELEKALADLKKLEGKLQSVKKGFQDSISILTQQLAQIKDPSELKRFIRDKKLNTKDLPAGWQTLSTIQAIGIGRTWIDYTDLTVKNILLTGVNVEVNPSKFYFAFAAGRVNYRFRDFIIKNQDKPKQSLYLLRAGVGRKERNFLIFTWYDGKRAMLNSFTGIGSTTAIRTPEERVIGMSVEARLQLDPNNYIVVESAKSSFHTTARLSQQRDGLLEKMWNFKDRSNEAYSIKLTSNWPQTQTRFTGYFRKMGEHFQSFNLQPVNVIQEAYQLKLQQQLWKKQLQIEASVRKNDFNSPFINPGLSSKTVFKSAQATLRVPKYPFITIGYYPSSQLTLLDNNTLVENQYNTLSAVSGYSYRVRKVSMNTNVVFLKFYNNSTDTGFIYYNARSITLTHFVFFKGLQLQSALTKVKQTDMAVTTLEQSASYQLRDWLTLSGGLKYNRVNHEQTLWGAIAGLGMLIKKIGTIQASFEKSYLPGTSRNLLPVEVGRVTYYRLF